MKQMKQKSLLLQVRDLTIASLDQVPFFYYPTCSDAVDELGSIVNFLRAGVPAVQLAFSSRNPHQLDYGRSKLILMLSRITLPNERFEVTPTVYDDGLEFATYSVFRSTEKK